MKALVGAFNQEKALVGAFSVIVQPVVEPVDRFAALVACVTLRYWGNDYPATAQYAGRLSPRVKRRKEKFSATSTSTQNCTFCAEKAEVEKAKIIGQTNCQHLKANDH